MQIEHTTITPAMAQQLLDNNSKNRTVSDSQVTFYAKQMEKGKWQNNGTTISIADDGTLLDGQHRLYACIRAKKPFETILVKGLNRDSFSTIDTGKVRSASDVLSIEGFKYTGFLAAAIKNIIVWEEGYRKNHYFSKSNSRRVTNEEIKEYALSNKKNTEIILKATKWYFAQKLLGSSALGLLYYLFYRIDHELANDFFEQLNSGVDINANSPIRHLRDKLIEMNMQKFIQHSQAYKMEYVILAWNKIRKNESGRFIVKIKDQISEPI
jgi:hypothetical protein